jgi:mercuric ion transport protein
MHPAAMAIKEESNSDRYGYAPALLAAGGLLGALAASSCCILPLVLFALGVSGAWIGNFTRLAPYQPIFLAGAFVCLSAGAWLVHRTAQSCAKREECARPLPHRLIAAALIAAALLVVAAISFDFLGPLLLS